MMNDYAKLKLTGVIEVKSGLHIGSGNEFSAIGAIDSPVIKDPATNLPIIPGSSLKGKMRSLLAKAYNEYIGANSTPNNDNYKITRLFGATSGGGKDKNQIIRGRLIFRDAEFLNVEELQEKGVRSYTEVKFENSIDRFTAVANPRQIERVIRGSKFSFELIYEINEVSEVDTDFKTIVDGIRLLEIDYLGGSGSRGYGKIAFQNLNVETVFGNYDSTELADLLKEY